MKKSEKQLLEEAAKILRGEHTLNEAQADVSKVLKVGKSLGGKVDEYENQIDFGQGAVIKVSASGNKIKFDGGLSSGKEEFDSVEDAIAALKKGSDKYESTELEEAVSSEVKNIMDSIPKLPESDMKDFLYGLYKVFKEKARAEKNADKKEVYNKIIPLFDSAWITWSQASPDGL